MLSPELDEGHDQVAECAHYLIVRRARTSHFEIIAMSSRPRGRRCRPYETGPWSSTYYSGDPVLSLGSPWMVAEVAPVPRPVAAAGLPSYSSCDRFLEAS